MRQSGRVVTLDNGLDNGLGGVPGDDMLMQFGAYPATGRVLDNAAQRA
jgi:hypothetical protein